MNNMPQTNQEWLNWLWANLSQDQWFVFGLAVVASMILTQILRGAIVGKDGKNKLPMMVIPFSWIPFIRGEWNLEIGVIRLIAFWIAAIITWHLWPQVGLLSNEYVAAGLSGIFAPATVKAFKAGRKKLKEKL